VPVVLGDAVQEMIVRSLGPMTRAIGLSLGPSARTVLLGSGTASTCALSGIEIARAVATNGGPAGLAPRMLKETLVEADRDLQDGTARLALIAAEILRSAWRITAGRRSALVIANAIEDARPGLAADLADLATDGSDPVGIAVAAGADDRLAAALAEVFRQVGPHGVIDIREDRRGGISSIMERGFVLDVSPIGSTASQALPDLPDVHILVADDIVADFGPMAAVLEGFAVRGKSLVIVARDVVGPALATITANQGAGLVSVAAMKPRDAGPRAAEAIGDLAAATGATVLGGPDGSTFAGAKPAHLGRASIFRLAEGRALFVDPKGVPETVAARVAEAEHAIARSRYQAFDREHAERRRARLDGRWAQLSIGDATNGDGRTRRAAARSALACLRSAAMGGVVAGGGVSLAQLGRRLRAAGPDNGTGHVLASGFGAVERHLLRNARSEGRGDETGAGVPVHDPLPMTQAIVDRALSFAAGLMRVEALVCR
jgi:chaperonin GroEL